MTKKRPIPKTAQQYREIAISETEQVRAILDYLKAIRVFAWRQNTGAFQRTYTRSDGTAKTSFVRFGFEGQPDIVGFIPGTDARPAVPLFIEVKKRPRKPTEAQQAFLSLASKNGACAFVAYCLEDVAAGLAEYREQQIGAGK